MTGDDYYVDDREGQFEALGEFYLGIHSPACSQDSCSVDDAWYAVCDDLAEQFAELFDDIFLGAAQTETLYTDDSRGRSRRLKDFTPAMRLTLKDRIPKFVGVEFGDDLLAQSMPVLGAGLRMIYQLEIDTQLGRDEDSDEDSCKVFDELKIDRRRVVRLLFNVVEEYILDSKDGVEVVGRIVAKRQLGPASAPAMPPSGVP